ncbi:MAG: acylphosphatase, partial [Thermoguttaceae bacterium]|nr:acylphosphatase [Thermoguttaceae bacterium]
MTPVRMFVKIYGDVQGVGFRPFVYHAARARGLAGWVRNEADTVRIEVQGRAEAVEEFVAALRHAPPQARIDRVEVREIPTRDGQRGEFTIRPSPSQGAPRPTIPADLATCEACLEEIRNPSERRYGYPFTNCTACGPRWSIIRQVPYDRARTSMAGFPMCPACDAEYRDPGDRRFHAQPIACPRCGPQLEWLDPAGRTLASRDQAFDEAVAALGAGRIVALKGLGGFQLLVDATSGPAVARLRQRKRRPDKPLAVMLASLDETCRRCEVGPGRNPGPGVAPGPDRLIAAAARRTGHVRRGRRGRAGQPLPRRDAPLHAAAPSADGPAQPARRLHQRKPLGRADGHLDRRGGLPARRNRRRVFGPRSAHRAAR